MSSATVFASPPNATKRLDFAGEIDAALDAAFPELKKIHPTLKTPRTLSKTMNVAAMKKFLEPHAGVVGEYLDALVNDDICAQADIVSAAYSRIGGGDLCIRMFVQLYMRAMLPYSGLVTCISQDLEVVESDDEDTTPLQEAKEKAKTITFSDDPISLNDDELVEETYKYFSYDVLAENIVDADDEEEDTPIMHLFRVITATPGSRAVFETQDLFKAFDKRDIDKFNSRVVTNITNLVALAAAAKVVDADVRQQHIKNTRDYFVGWLMANHLIDLRELIRLAEAKAAHKARGREEEADDGGQKRRAVGKSP